MTKPEPAEGADIAARLLWLAMLADIAEKADKALRMELSRGAEVGEKWPHTVPDEDDPTATLDAGTVRFDPGTVTLRVDEPVFLAWVRREYPLRVVTQPASDGRRMATDGEIGVLAEILAKVTADDYRGFDPYHTMAAVLWDRLQDAGYQVTELQPTDERSVVEPGWREQLVKHLKELAKQEPPGDVTPIDANGLEVEGVSLSAGPPKLVVTPSKDRYVTGAFSRQLLGVGFRELMPADTPKQLDKTAQSDRVEK